MKKNIKFTIPSQVEYIIKTLNEAGEEAYIVGGCVRDKLLGLEPKDYDITSSARPNKVKKIFPHTVDTGIDHGTVSVLIKEKAYEVTTYRLDGDYINNRWPKEVVFTNSLKEDMKRRDFTINAMAYHKDHGLIDYFGGIKDLEDGIIRSVGQASERFDEDALRLLRAIRFAARFAYTIEEATSNAIFLKAPLIKNISKERIKLEIDKILESSNPEYFTKLFDYGLIDHIIAEFQRIGQEEKLAYEAMSGLDLVSRYIILFRAYIFLNLDFTETRAKEVKLSLVKKILKDLKFDNKTIYEIMNVLSNYDYDLEIKNLSDDQAKSLLRRALNKKRLGRETLYRILSIRKRILQVNLKETKDIDRTIKILDDIIENNEVYDLKNLKINGRDLMALGLKKGKEIGLTLDCLLECVIDNQVLNQQDILKKMAVEIINKHID